MPGFCETWYAIGGQFILVPKWLFSKLLRWEESGACGSILN